MPKCRNPEAKAQAIRPLHLGFDSKAVRPTPIVSASELNNVLPSTAHVCNFHFLRFQTVPLCVHIRVRAMRVDCELTAKTSCMHCPSVSKLESTALQHLLHSRSILMQTCIGEFRKCQISKALSVDRCLKFCLTVFFSHTRRHGDVLFGFKHNCKWFPQFG